MAFSLLEFLGLKKKRSESEADPIGGDTEDAFGDDGGEGDGGGEGGGDGE